VGPDICRHQCLLSSAGNVVTVTPLDAAATVYVNGLPITGSTVLKNGAALLLGRGYLFRLIDPLYEQVGYSAADAFLIPQGLLMDLLMLLSSSVEKLPWWWVPGKVRLTRIIISKAVKILVEQHCKLIECFTALKLKKEMKETETINVFYCLQFV
jgi:hypothetical protein